MTGKMSEQPAKAKAAAKPDKPKATAAKPKAAATAKPAKPKAAAKSAKPTKPKAAAAKPKAAAAKPKAAAAKPKGLHLAVHSGPGSATVSQASDLVLKGAMAAGRTLMLVHSPGCGWCLRLRPAWDEAKGELLGKGVHVLEMETDSVRNSAPCAMHSLLDSSEYSGGVPHIILIVPSLRRGQPKVQQYDGDRSSADLVSFGLGIPQVKPAATVAPGGNPFMPPLFF